MYKPQVICCCIGALSLLTALHHYAFLQSSSSNSILPSATTKSSRLQLKLKFCCNICDILSSISKIIITINVKPETVSRLHAGNDVVCNELSPLVHSCQQKSIGLIFSKSQTGSDMWYSCHHNSSRFTFPIFAHSCCFSVLHSLQSITPRIY